MKLPLPSLRIVSPFILLSFLGNVFAQTSDLQQPHTSALVASTNNCMLEAELRVTQTSLGSPLEGPYLPGEFVSFSYTILNYRADPVNLGNQCQWLQGIIPVFGNGWNPASFRATGRPDIASTPSNLWEWYTEGEVRYNFPTNQLSIFQDPVFNRLAICRNGDPDCVNTGIGQADELLPAGWFVTTEDSRAPCPLAGIDPNDSWGIPQECGSNRSHGTFTFRLQVRTFEGPTGCDETGFTDCSVKVFAFSDAETGCFIGNNELCSFDAPVSFSGTNQCIPTNPAARFYNNSIPHCFTNENRSTRLTMGILPPFTARAWPRCSSAEQLVNPNWFTFTARNNRMRIEMKVEECLLNEGIRWSLFEIPCRFRMNQPTGSANPNSLPNPISGCNNLNSPTIGSQVIEFDATPGQLYGILIDGWDGDLCEITFELLNNDELPSLKNQVFEAPTADFERYGFLTDTICLGANGVVFEANIVYGACRYFWTLRTEDEPNRFFEFQRTISLDFTELKEYELCVYATNYCDTTATRCRKIVVSPSNDSYIVKDSICQGERYTWLDENGEIIEELPPQNTSGLNTFTRILDNEGGDCSISAVLELFVNKVNFDNPSPVDTFNCFTLQQIEPFVFFCDTLPTPGFYERVQCISATTGCDTFFNVTFEVLGGPLEIVSTCDGEGQMGFSVIDAQQEGYTSWSEQFEIFQNNPQFSLQYQWRARNGQANIGTSPQVFISQEDMLALSSNESFQISLDLSILLNGSNVCNSTPSTQLLLSNEFPVINNIIGERQYLLGQNDLNYSLNFSQPANPSHNQPQDRVSSFLWELPTGFSFNPPTGPLSENIVISAPFGDGGNELCATVRTNRCNFTDRLCIELTRAEIQANITSLDFCGQFIFEAETTDQGSIQYLWQVDPATIIGPNTGKTVMIAPHPTDSSTVSVMVSGSGIGVDSIRIGPSPSNSIITDLSEHPRSIYKRNCQGSTLIVMTEPACQIRWGYYDSLQNEWVFPLLNDALEPIETAYLEINDRDSKGRNYFIERIISCDPNVCSAELIFVRSARQVSCQNKETKWQIFPNPSSGWIQIIGTELVHDSYIFELVDISGRLVLKKKIYNQGDNMKEELDLNLIQDGTYMLIVRDERQSLLKSFTLIIQK